MQFFCNLSRNGVGKQVAGRMQCVTCPLCRGHVTRYNLGLQLAMVSKQSMQLLHEVELRFTL